VNWAEIREWFPALQHWTYLNSATYGQIPLRTEAAVARHFARRNETACGDFLSWFDDVDEIRGLVARLINCEAADVAFCSNASTALSLFLGGVEWKAGDRIVTLKDEFPNQFYYAKSLGAWGVEVVELDGFEGLSSLPERTRAVVVSSVNYSSGYRPDLVEVSRITHDAGALLYVDGTQSVGALRMDVRAIRPDMMASDTYKWLLSPNGATFFYVSPELRRVLDPSVIGWRSDRGWRSVDSLNHGAPVFAEGAERYEGGMLDFPSLYGLAESLRINLEIGPEAIEARVLEMAGMAGAAMKSCGAAIRHEGTNVVAAYWPDRDVSGLARRLREQKILVAARHGNLRVSAHFYNDERDIERLRLAIAG
jgi:selenocysteine lyase/cysteine desulfurase